jgi:hypothetical protein
VTTESTPSFSSTAATIIDGYTSEAGFAAAVYISDKFAMVGTGRNNNALTVGAANKAFIFELDAATETWPKTAVTSITGYTSQSAFGFDVAINDKFAVVGAYFAKKAFVFTRGEDGKWSSTASSVILSEKGTFGWSVALANEYLMVGAGGWPANRANEAFIYRYGSGARVTAAVDWETWYNLEGEKGDDSMPDRPRQDDDIKWAYNSNFEPHAVFMFNEQYCRASRTSQPFEEISYDPDRVFCSYIGSNAGDKCTWDTWDKPASNSNTYVVETGERHVYKVQFISESSGDNDDGVRFRYENISPGGTAAPSIAPTTTPTSSPSSMPSAHPGADPTSAPSSSPTMWSPPPPPGALSSVFGTSDSVTLIIAATFSVVLACIAFAACAFFYRRHSVKIKEGKSSESSSAEAETSKDDMDEDEDDIDDYVHNPLNDTPLHQSADIEIADEDEDVSLHSVYEDKDADMQCEYPSEERVSRWDGSTLTFTSNPMLGEGGDTSAPAPAPAPASPPPPLPRGSSVQKESGDEDSGGDAGVSPTRRNFEPTFEQNVSGNSSYSVGKQRGIVPGMKEGEGASKKGIEHQIYRKVLPAMVSVQLKKVGE